MIRYARIDTPLGKLLATAEDDRLTGLYFDGQAHAPTPRAEWKEEKAGAGLFEQCARQVGEYLGGKRHAFELPLAPAGTEFQQRVWREIARIPFGETLTYAELARRAGAPGSARAAGAATGRNPLSIVVPCHRVVGAAGALTGYAGGIERKERLLALEAARASLAA
jgi:methylated-DNA-[protein]-cysteine S-methyltransferase